MFVAFIGLVTAGVMKGVKDWREFKKPDAATPVTTAAQVAAVTILENVTLNEWSRSNREVAVAIGRLCDTLAKNTDEVIELRHEMREQRR